MVREVPPSGRRSRRRHHHATVLAAAIVREGAKAGCRGMNPMDLKRGIDLAWRRGRRPRQELQEVTSNEEIAQVAPSRQWRRRDRQVPLRRHEEGRQRGRHHS